jgi:HNH endonuclease
MIGGVTVNAVRRKRTDLGLKKTKESLLKIYARPNPGQFQKGCKSLNTLHDHAITIRIDPKTGRMYKWIRLSANIWKMLNVYLWEKAGNALPKGYLVRFKDGNTMNCASGNLELITRAENLRLNRNKFFEVNGRHYPAGYDKKISFKSLR